MGVLTQSFWSPWWFSEDLHVFIEKDLTFKMKGCQYQPPEEHEFGLYN